MVESQEILLQKLVGRTIESIGTRKSYEGEGSCDVLRIQFTDGHAAEIRSQDYSSYRSWMELTVCPS